MHFRLFNETYFVWLDSLTNLFINPTNIFLISGNIFLYHALFIKYLWIPQISLLLTGLKLTEKNFITPPNPVFFKLLIAKSFSIT